ncbi:major facilitator superfamily domain-containing protein 8 [Elysia marginata]|uniref:Major facilitator superfamily domain-containing protein 8 n=1 Tax=Elysia marginata TaxID=1093978 RepID=A0AAV4IH54_9GAST|nr:major facilitator superfamily domain-containing protein 8 [Elysia marginata]
MVLPLSLEYLDFGELENSLLYFVCGVEIIVVFMVLTRLTKCISDRVLILFGAVLIISSNAWLLYFLPKLDKHNRGHNLPIFAVAVVLDVLSLPFLIVCSTSLFSKLTRKQTQGSLPASPLSLSAKCLSQGLRRALVSVGNIMAPMWGSSASTKPELLIGVLVALQSLSLILCILSFRRLKPPSVIDPVEEHIASPGPSVSVPPDRRENHNGSGNTEEAADVNYEESEEWVGGASINSRPIDRSHHGRPPEAEEYFDSQSPRDRASSTAAGFLTPYGSIARSSSFRSMQSISSVGSPPLWSSPTA